MKRFILSCIIMTAASTMVFAQAAKTAANDKGAAKTTKVATTAFNEKVNLFEAGVQRDNMEQAKQNFESLKLIMSDDLRSLKPKIMNAPNATEKEKWTQVLQKKQNIYFEIINAASDMRGNGAAMVKKYREYAATL